MNSQSIDINEKLRTLLELLAENEIVEFKQAKNNFHFNDLGRYFNKGFDKQYYIDLICKAIREHGSLTRKDIDELLWNKLPDWMDDNQRKNKVTNLIAECRRSGKIANHGSDSQPKWVLVK